MCGITGVYQVKNANKERLKEAARRMNQSQARRGPDDEGIFIDEKNGIAFGHRRLSILDLSEKGHQPMVWKNGSILRTSDVPNINGNVRTSDVPVLVITYNGEIYNFWELKKELEKKGYKFKTKTDTEVILALYSEYGEKSFEMLRGMFAFGLWDGKNQKLFLVKDRYGIKPLYYFSDNDKLIFASTVKAITESGLIPLQKNPDAFIGFLLFGSVPLPMTTYKNVLAVPAGHYLAREDGGKQKLVKYYAPLEFFNISTSDVNNISTSDVDNIVGSVRRRLEESINLHLISDAPLGVFLSGGLDSSALVALAALNTGKSDLPNIDVNVRRSDFPNGVQKLITLSIIFDEPEFSEQKYQRLVAQKIGSDHREIKITRQDFFDSFDEIFEAMDQPTINGVNTFFIAQAAKKAGLKTALSGLGADEIFLGYSHFRRANLFKNIQKLLSIFGHRKSVGLAMSKILNLLGDRYSKLSYFANNDILNFYLGVRGLFSPQETAKILDIREDEVNNFIKDLIKLTNLQTYELTNLHPINLLSCLELKFYLHNQLLKDTDFMSMRHSIEVRVPFLDHPLVEYLSGLPPEAKLNIGKSDLPNIDVNVRRSDFHSRLKPLLAAAVGDILPQEIFLRPKMGFTFPFQKWLREKQDFRGHWSRAWAKKVLKLWKL
jgi:asparagine synthase (glutamine-hydrolysing)